MASIKPINFERHDIGARIKKSKAQFIWKFSLDSTLVTIELICSHLSGKKKIYKDGKMIFEIQKFGTSFQYPFQINNHMLNIVQHGDMFELRIDNQSFSHLYHQDRTKRAFVYDGEEPQPQRDDDDDGYYGHSKDRYNEDQKRQEREDYGYGGYKKGHSDVDSSWQNRQHSSGKMNRNEENAWDDVRKAKNHQAASHQSDARNKPYDSFSPPRNNSGSTFNFDDASKGGGIVKKAEYINKAQTTKQQTVDNLMDFGGSTIQQPKKFEDLFNQGGQQSQQKQTQNNTGGFFDFDFNTSSSQTQQPQTFDFDFQSSTQPSKTFDFNSYTAQPQKQPSPSKNLLDIIESQPQKSVDDLLGSALHSDPLMMSQQNQLMLEEQKKIQELLATGYKNPSTNAQFQPNPIQQSQFLGGFNSLEKENLEKKLVDLDSLSLIQPKQSVNDPFAEAFANPVKSTLKEQSKNDAFSFVQQQIQSDTSSNSLQSMGFGNQDVKQGQQQPLIQSNDFFFGFQQQQIQQPIGNQNDFNFF